MLNNFKDINYSIWCDFIERDFIQSEFEELIEKNIINGATSNPAIFANAIKTSKAYKEQITLLKGNNPKKIYETLAIEDIKQAAIKLEPLYQKNKQEGYISIEVDPNYCNDAFATIEEGARIFEAIGKENVMIKIPATEAGYTAMQNLAAHGININATLIFSKEQAINATKAISEGIAKAKKETFGVISIFVSRFDRKMDDFFQKNNLPISKLGIMNALNCYYEIEDFGNKNIRSLFASTGVKGDNLDPSYYITNLIYPNSINTAPLDTIKEYLKQDNFQKTNPISKDEVKEYLTMLSNSNINLDKISNELLNDGLKAFIDSFNDMLKKLK